MLVSLLAVLLFSLLYFFSYAVSISPQPFLWEWCISPAAIHRVLRALLRARVALFAPCQHAHLHICNTLTFSYQVQVSDGPKALAAINAFLVFLHGTADGDAPMMGYNNHVSTNTPPLYLYLFYFLPLKLHD